MRCIVLGILLLLNLEVVASLRCYWCSGVGEDRQCETTPHLVSTGPGAIDCRTEYCISSKVIDAVTGEVKSFARLCDSVPRGNVCVRDPRLVTCFETCTHDLCNSGNPDPALYPVPTYTAPALPGVLGGREHMGALWATQHHAQLLHEHPPAEVETETTHRRGPPERAAPQRPLRKKYRGGSKVSRRMNIHNTAARGDNLSRGAGNQENNDMQKQFVQKDRHVQGQTNLHKSVEEEINYKYPFYDRKSVHFHPHTRYEGKPRSRFQFKTFNSESKGAGGNLLHETRNLSYADAAAKPRKGENVSRVKIYGLSSIPYSPDMMDNVRAFWRRAESHKRKGMSDNETNGKRKHSFKKSPFAMRNPNATSEPMEKEHIRRRTFQDRTSTETMVGNVDMNSAGDHKSRRYWWDYLPDKSSKTDGSSTESVKSFEAHNSAPQQNDEKSQTKWRFSKDLERKERLDRKKTRDGLYKGSNNNFNRHMSQTDGHLPLPSSGGKRDSIYENKSTNGVSVSDVMGNQDKKLPARGNVMSHITPTAQPTTTIKWWAHGRVEKDDQYNDMGVSPSPYASRVTNKMGKSDRKLTYWLYSPRFPSHGVTPSSYAHRKQLVPYRVMGLKKHKEQYKSMPLPVENADFRTKLPQQKEKSSSERLMKSPFTPRPRFDDPSEFYTLNQIRYGKGKTSRQSGKTSVSERNQRGHWLQSEGFRARRNRIYRPMPKPEAYSNAIEGKDILMKLRKVAKTARPQPRKMWYDLAQANKIGSSQAQNRLPVYDASSKTKVNAIKESQDVEIARLSTQDSRFRDVSDDRVSKQNYHDHTDFGINIDPSTIGSSSNATKPTTVQSSPVKDRNGWTLVKYSVTPKYSTVNSEVYMGHIERDDDGRYKLHLTPSTSKFNRRTTLSTLQPYAAQRDSLLSKMSSPRSFRNQTSGKRERIPDHSNRVYPFTLNATGSHSSTTRLPSISPQGSKVVTLLPGNYKSTTTRASNRPLPTDLPKLIAVTTVEPPQGTDRYARLGHAPHDDKTIILRNNRPNQSPSSHYQFHQTATKMPRPQSPDLRVPLVIHSRTEQTSRKLSSYKTYNNDRRQAPVSSHSKLTTRLPYTTTRKYQTTSSGSTVTNIPEGGQITMNYKPTKDSLHYKTKTSRPQTHTLAHTLTTAKHSKLSQSHGAPSQIKPAASAKKIILSLTKSAEPVTPTSRSKYSRRPSNVPNNIGATDTAQDKSEIESRQSVSGTPRSWAMPHNSQSFSLSSSKSSSQNVMGGNETSAIPQSSSVPQTSRHGHYRTTGIDERTRKFFTAGTPQPQRMETSRPTSSTSNITDETPVAGKQNKSQISNDIKLQMAKSQPTGSDNGQISVGKTQSNTHDVRENSPRKIQGQQQAKTPLRKVPVPTIFLPQEMPQVSKKEEQPGRRSWLMSFDRNSATGNTITLGVWTCITLISTLLWLI